MEIRPKDWFAQRALQGLQGGSGTKRKRKKRKQTGGIYPPIHYPGGNYPGHDYLYNYPKYPGSMIGRGEDEESMSIEMIVRSIPKSMKKRAEALLAHLKEREDVITWDDMGQVLVDGVLIPRSNITDLVSDAMRSRKNFNPIGVREFSFRCHRL